MSKKSFEHLNQIVEAVIFASDEPITAEQVRATVEDTTVAQVKKCVTELNHEYSQQNRSFHIIEVAGGYQMVTRESYAQWIKRLYVKKNKARLSQAALETLSVIAFKQPVSKTDISVIRGVNCDGVVKTLLERKLISIGGRDEGPGRPLLYKTTKEFLRYFGINSIDDLPKPREIEEMLKEDAVAPAGDEDSGIPIDDDLRAKLTGAPTQEEPEPAEAAEQPAAGGDAAE
ncbi:SMC-Scp complex subunit ScpB [bacterium]|nr:SMC-Scp complex subunit ScpB [bacterium]